MVKVNELNSLQMCTGQLSVEAKEHAFLSSTLYRCLISFMLQPLYPKIKKKNFVKF